MQEPARLRDLDESEILARIFPLLGDRTGVVVPPGDDAAVVEAPSGSVIASTDSMIRGLDWRDDWSSGHDVGHKIVAQNVADIAAMGGVPTGLLVSLAADPDTEVGWVLDLTRGIAEGAHDAGCPVVGGDLSGAPPGVVVVQVTALGDLQGRPAVLRSGARPGDLVAVAGSLGWSGGGLQLYAAGVTPPRLTLASAPLDLARATLMSAHRTAARPPYEAGPSAALAGAHALIDVSDGLVRDVGRIGRASGVAIDLDGVALRGMALGLLTTALGAADALRQVLSGGEEHSLVGCFPPDALPADDPVGWRVIGRVIAAEHGATRRVTVDGEPAEVTGWDHFRR